MPAPENSLLIRADANADIGTGHVMRCLTLATSWTRKGGRATFLSWDLPNAIAHRLSEKNITLLNLSAGPGTPEDLAETQRHARDLAARWLVVDGYHLTALLPPSTPHHDESCRVMLIDDLGRTRSPHANIILDQNAGAEESAYPGLPSTSRLLLGCRFVLLREEFIESRRPESAPPHHARNILVTLGGSDPHNTLELILESIRSIRHDDVRVTVIAGPLNPRFDQLHVLASALPVHVNLHRSVDNLAELMAGADLAIAAPGITAWELAHMGVPSLLVTLEENQRSNGEFLGRKGIAHDLGSHAELTPTNLAAAIDTFVASPEKRSSMAHRGRQLVDGLGCERVWRHMNDDTLHFENAAESDAKQIWEWSNEPSVREASFSSETIPWDDHVQWFARRLRDSNYPFWIAKDRDNAPVGQVRFEIRGADATIALSLAPSARGRGSGSLLIWLACRKLFAESRAKRILAYIKPSNAPSIHAFAKAGFVKTAETEVKNQPALLYSLDQAHLL